MAMGLQHHWLLQTDTVLGHEDSEQLDTDKENSYLGQGSTRSLD